MKILAYEPSGFEGVLVHVEVDIRRGIPAVDLVGLAAGAVKEARERVRAAVRNSGFDFPQDRVLVNLAPADLPKEGSSYDLPLALALLLASGVLPESGFPFLAMGELRLDGSVSPVRAVLPAIAKALSGGIQRFIVPRDNLPEAQALGKGLVYPIEKLCEAPLILAALREGQPYPAYREVPASKSASITAAEDQDRREAGDFSEVKGQAALIRALEIAAAGGHNVFISGPPGCGKTMSSRRFPGILPDLAESEAVEVASLYSLYGRYGQEAVLSRRPPFRSPHHSASLEGLIGGGKNLRPGEISLAHRGVLFLDEATEFRSNVLQALREPLEDGCVSLVRAGKIARFPADFQLIIAANPCPCGNLGQIGKVCVCSIQDLQRYRRKLGGPLLDRIDIRVALSPANPSSLLGRGGEESLSIRQRVEAARRIQAARAPCSPHPDERSLDFRRKGSPLGDQRRSKAFLLNSRLGSSMVEHSCLLGAEAARAFRHAVDKLSLSSRACHSVLKLARTIADLSNSDGIDAAAVLEAVELRRFGDGDEIWPMR